MLTMRVIVKLFNNFGTKNKSISMTLQNVALHYEIPRISFRNSLNESKATITSFVLIQI